MVFVIAVVSSCPTVVYAVVCEKGALVVTVPVVIKENETTTLDFDGNHFRQKSPTGAGQWVRLPSGEVIGMRAP